MAELSLRDRVPIFNGYGRVCGAIITDAMGQTWLEKHGLDPHVHQLRAPAGWATDEVHLAQLRAMGGASVRLHLRDGRVLEARLDDLDRHGIPLNRGFGDQVVLPLKWWRAHPPNARQLALFDAMGGIVS